MLKFGYIKILLNNWVIWVMLLSNENNLYVSSSSIMSSAFITLLSAENMNGENYTSWKNMITIVLIVEDLKFAINEKCPQFLVQNASQNVHDAYEKWVKANDKARAYVFA